MHAAHGGYRRGLEKCLNYSALLLGNGGDVVATCPNIEASTHLQLTTLAKLSKEGSSRVGYSSDVLVLQ